MAYAWSGVRSRSALRDQAEGALTAATMTGWDGLLAEQREYLDAFWDAADVELEGDGEVQQAVRFALFHLVQAGARAGRRARTRRAPVERPTVLEVDDLRLDPAAHRPWRGGDGLHLPAKDVALLETLLRQENHFYKIIDEHTILIAADTPQNRKSYEDLVIKTFFLSNADVTEVANALRASALALALVMAAGSGHDPNDPTSLPQAQARFVASSVDARLRKPLSIGWLSQPWRSSTPEIAAAISKAMDVMRKNGATVEEIDLPSGPWEQTGTVTVEAEASTSFENLIRSGKVAELADPNDRIGGYVREEVRASDYLRAQRVRRILERKMRDLYRRFDVIAAPGTGGTAPPLHSQPEEERRRRRSFTERPPGRSSPTTVGNLCGLPAIAVPCGFSSKEGLPIGLQFMGPALGETAVLAAAALYQQHTNWHKRRPPIS